MGIYQLDHRLRSGLSNPIIGFRFKQVIKTAARAFFQQTGSSWSELSFKWRPYECKECSILARVTLSVFACTIRHSTRPLTLSKHTCTEGDRFGCQSMLDASIIAGSANSNYLTTHGCCFSLKTARKQSFIKCVELISSVDGILLLPLLPGSPAGPCGYVFSFPSTWCHFSFGCLSREGKEGKRKEKNTVRNNRTKECNAGCDEIHQEGLLLIALTSLGRLKATGGKAAGESGRNVNGGGCEAESSCNRNCVSRGGNIRLIPTDSSLQRHKLQKTKSGLVDKNDDVSLLLCRSMDGAGSLIRLFIFGTFFLTIWVTKSLTTRIYKRK